MSDFTSILPIEILAIIFTNFRVLQIIGIKLVCKRWNLLFSEILINDALFRQITTSRFWTCLNDAKRDYRFFNTKEYQKEIITLNDISDPCRFDITKFGWFSKTNTYWAFGCTEKSSKFSVLAYDPIQKIWKTNTWNSDATILNFDTRTCVSHHEFTRLYRKVNKVIQLKEDSHEILDTWEFPTDSKMRTAFCTDKISCCILYQDNDSKNHLHYWIPGGSKHELIHICSFSKDASFQFSKAEKGINMFEITREYYLTGILWHVIMWRLKYNGKLKFLWGNSIQQIKWKITQEPFIIESIPSIFLLSMVKTEKRELYLENFDTGEFAKTNIGECWTPHISRMNEKHSSKLRSEVRHTGRTEIFISIEKNIQIITTHEYKPQSTKFEEKRFISTTNHTWSSGYVKTFNKKKIDLEMGIDIGSEKLGDLFGNDQWSHRKHIGMSKHSIIECGLGTLYTPDGLFYILKTDDIDSIVHVTTK